MSMRPRASSPIVGARRVWHIGQNHAGHHGARGDADAQLKPGLVTKAVDERQHVAPQTNNTLGLIGRRYGNASDGHLGVADRLDLFDAMERRQPVKLTDDPVEQLDHTHGTKPYRQRYEPGDVRKQHGVDHLLVMGLERIGRTTR
jgi:hypothetical protein